MRKEYLIITIVLVTAILLGGCDISSADTSGTGGGTSTERSSLAAGGVSPVGNGYPSGLVVVGTGTVEADPDIAYLTLGVDLRGEDAAAVVADASGRMERILAAVQGAGVAEEDIRTAGYNLWVEQRYNPNTGRPTDEIDYHVSHTVRVTVRDLGQVGTILSEAVAAGANSVGGVSFSVEDTEALNTVARQQAFADAQKKAQEMAEALGITLGKVISVSESGGWSPAPVYRDSGGGLESAAAVPMPAGSFSISISVVVVYELP